MVIKSWNSHTNLILLGLIILMGITRIHHFGSITTLPDASLAVFFFAGLYLRRWFVFPLFLLEAGLIDYLAISVGGVSDWCVTPAYLFMIPTYAVMWEAGRFCTGRINYNMSQLLLVLATVLIATTVAFLISNAAFYTLSGRFEDLRIAEYFKSVARYYPLYMATTLAYSTVILILHMLINVMSERRKASL